MTENAPPPRTFGTVTGQHVFIERFERNYGRPGAARHALLRMAMASSDPSTLEEGSFHEYDEGEQTLSIVHQGQHVFVLPVDKNDPRKRSACQRMTWPRFHLEHPAAAAALEYAIQQHCEQHPEQIIPDHVMAHYSEPLASHQPQEPASC